MFKQTSAVVLKRQCGAFDQVIEQLGLTKFWQLIQRSNLSATAPYHSNEHMYHVARVAYELYCLDKVVSGGYRRNAARNLVAAGLVHDYSHTMGVCADSVNIAIVLSHIKTWRETQFADLVDWDVVSGLVASTEFPYVGTADDYPSNHVYLRDADLMYGFEPHAMDAVMLGISAEAEHKLGRRMGPMEFLEAQRKFLDGVTPTTEPGKKIWAKGVEDAYAMQKAFGEYVESMNLSPFKKP